MPAAGGRPVEPPPYESDILAARPVRYYIGLGAGVLAFQHNGEFLPDPFRCNCVFSDKSETVFHYAAEVSVHFPKRNYGFKLLFQYLDYSGEFAYTFSRSALIAGQDTNEVAEFRKSSDVELEYFTLTPSFAWYIPKTLVFLHGGLEIGVPLTARYDNRENILTPGYSYDSTGTKFEYTFLSKTDIPEVPSVRLGLHLGAGVDIKLSDRFYVTPQAGATIPLNPVSTQHDSWKVTSEFALVLIKYRL